MIGDPECLFLIAMDISGPQANKNPQLHIMNRVSYIKTQVIVKQKSLVASTVSKCYNTSD